MMFPLGFGFGRCADLPPPRLAERARSLLLRFLLCVTFRRARMLMLPAVSGNRSTHAVCAAPENFPRRRVRRRRAGVYAAEPECCRSRGAVSYDVVPALRPRTGPGGGRTASAVRRVLRC